MRITTTPSSTFRLFFGFSLAVCGAAEAAAAAASASAGERKITHASLPLLPEATLSGQSIDGSFDALPLTKLRRPHQQQQQQQQQQEGRALQGASYSADYQAGFQFILDDGCAGPNPTILVFCDENLVINGVSDPSIDCTVLDDPIGGFVTAQCVNNCANRAACEAVFLNSGENEGTPYATIDFTCSGESPTSIDAAMAFLGTDGNTCGDSTTTTDLDFRIFHMAQLAIVCDGSPLAADYFMECELADLNGRFNNDYTCLAGRNCQGEACTVDVEAVIINVDLSRLASAADSCVTTQFGATYPPEDDPFWTISVTDRPLGFYAAQFQTNWRILTGINCNVRANPEIQILCANGVISDVEGITPSVTCRTLNDDSIRCQETNADAFEDALSGVTYTCTARNAIPTVETVFPSASVDCTTATTPRTNFQLVELGVFCDSPDEVADYNYDDFYSECANGDNYFYDGPRYSCFESVEHPGGSAILSIGQVEQGMDLLRWPNLETDFCFTFTTDGGSPSTPTAPNNMPTTSPTTSPGDTVGMTSSPTATPQRGVVPNPSENDGGGGGSGGLIIGIVGALAGVMLIAVGVGVYCCLQKKRDQDAQTHVYPGAAPAATPAETETPTTYYPVAGVPAPAPYVMAVVPPDEPVMAVVFDPHKEAVVPAAVASVDPTSTGVEPEYSYAVDL